MFSFRLLSEAWLTTGNWGLSCRAFNAFSQVHVKRTVLCTKTIYTWCEVEQAAGPKKGASPPCLHMLSRTCQKFCTWFQVEWEVSLTQGDARSLHLWFCSELCIDHRSIFKPSPAFFLYLPSCIWVRRTCLSLVGLCRPHRWKWEQHWQQRRNGECRGSNGMPTQF